MIMMITKIILALLFASINIAHAWHDSERIKMGKHIYHGLNGLFYIILLLPIYIELKNIYLIIGLLCLRRVVFDTALNLFRGLRFDYISSHTTSIIDRISYKFQARFGYVPYYGIFILASIILIIL